MIEEGFSGGRAERPNLCDVHDLRVFRSGGIYVVRFPVRSFGEHSPIDPEGSSMVCVCCRSQCVGGVESCGFCVLLGSQKGCTAIG